MRLARVLYLFYVEGLDLSLIEQIMDDEDCRQAARHGNILATEENLDAE